MSFLIVTLSGIGATACTKTVTSLIRSGTLQPVDDFIPTLATARFYVSPIYGFELGSYAHSVAYNKTERVLQLSRYEWKIFTSGISVFYFFIVTSERVIRRLMKVAPLKSMNYNELS